MLACEDDREHKDPVEKAIVLEVDVVDNKQSGGQEDRETGNMSQVPASQGHRLHKSSIFSATGDRATKLRKPYRSNANTRTSSLSITVALWK